MGVVYEDRPLVLYRGEGSVPELRGISGAVYLTVSYANAHYHAGTCYHGQQRVLVIDGIQIHPLFYEGPVSDSSSLNFSTPRLEDNQCEAIIPLDAPDHLEQIIDASCRIINRYKSHPNYERDMQTLQKLMKKLCGQ